MRKRAWAILAFALLLTGAARADGAVCVATDSFACLVDESGKTLVGDVEDAFCVREGALYAAGRRGAYRLYDAAGNALGDTAFDMICDAGDCLIFRQGSGYGAMSAAGEVLLPATWTQLVPDGAGGFLALDTDPLDESPDAILRVDAAGESAPTGTSTSGGLSWLSDWRMPVMAQNGRFGAIDAAGHWAIPPKWLSMGPFEAGCARVYGPDGYGLIDAQGNEIIPAACAWLERGDGMIAALSDGGVDVYAADGSKLLYRVEGASLEAAVAGRCLLVRDGAQTRLYGLSGDLLGTFGPDFTCAPGLDGQLIASQGEWGEACAWLMDPDGSAASERFQQLLPLAGGRYAFSEMKGIEYRSAELGRVQTSWDYDTLRFGVIDAKGGLILPARYREIRALAGNRLLLIADGSVTLTDLDGKPVRTWLTAETEAPTGE